MTDHPRGVNHIGYRGQHLRVERARGKPSLCEHCLTTDPAAHYQWAFNNVGDRDNVEDYIRLCGHCHYGWLDIDTEPLRHYEFTKPEGQRPLHEPSYIANGEPVLLSLGHYPDRLDEGVYHSWSCLCDDCLREDYALCQYYPGGALTMESWRKMYYKGRY